MLVDKIYDEEVYSKNQIYNRECVLKSINNAMKRLNESISSMSIDDMNEGLDEYINAMHGIVLYKKNGISFVSIDDEIYCFLISESSDIDVNKIASQNLFREYIVVNSIPTFLIERMKEKLFLLLLRDYDTLNYVPEEFQLIKSEIISKKWTLPAFRTILLKSGECFTESIPNFV